MGYMGKVKIPPDLERYSLWVRVNRQIEGPILTLSLLYMLFYIVILVLWTIKPGVYSPFLTYLGIGFLFFISTAYIAFSGFLLRSIR
jgi:hypothetical protein